MKRKLVTLLGAILVSATLDLQPSTVLAQIVEYTTLTVSNPSATVGDQFGLAVASMDAKRFLITSRSADTGALDAGVAYLFGIDGKLLTTFTNPTPDIGDWFGYSISAVGADHLVIGATQDDTGATNAGAAYLFCTNGVLMTTFTNPSPSLYGYFGCSVAALGTDRVLIGAFGSNLGATDAGVAFLFSTNGRLLTTITNPTPAPSDYFGYSVAAIGTGQILVGSFYGDTGATNAGAAYLFDTNGTLLRIFPNPTPKLEDYFGGSFSVLESGCVMISAQGDAAGAYKAGAAYLFTANGELLTTFTNPTPASADFFGKSLAVVGEDRVLISASLDNTGAADAGAAYLFSTNGALLITFTNPIPAIGAYFGNSVASVGDKRLLIGAYGDNSSTGVAYLVTLAESESGTPSLSIGPTTNAVRLIFDTLKNWTIGYQ